MDNIATYVEITPRPARGTMQIPYTASGYQKSILSAKTKTEVIQAMYEFISAHGGNANACGEYWDKLRKMGVEVKSV